MRNLHTVDLGTAHSRRVSSKSSVAAGGGGGEGARRKSLLRNAGGAGLQSCSSVMLRRLILRVWARLANIKMRKCSRICPHGRRVMWFGS